MSIRIQSETCIGCGRCEEVCPGSLISLKDGKARIGYPKDCWGCVSCIKECSSGAIDFFLGADIGGRGAVMQVISEGDILHWKIKRRDGTEVVIDVNRSSSNCY